MNFDNRTLFIADNLDIMRGMDSDTIDLIYLDPPFKSGRQWKAPIGSPAEGAEFKDIWTDEDIKDEWHGVIAAEHEELYQIIQASEVVYDKSMKIYLTAMAVRLFEMKRILKRTGSIYLHCDSTANHYLKMVMDSLFGKQNFRNEIVWKRQTANNAVSRKYGNIADQLLFYTKGNKYNWNQQYGARSESAQKEFRHKDDKGRIYRTHDLTAPGTNPDRMFKWQGTIPYRNWAYSKEKLDEMLSNGDIWLREDGTVSASRGRKIFLENALKRGTKLQTIWDDIAKVGTSKERTGYPTQKPLALLERIIKASSNEGDMVLDPFCGCATACVAAERLHRQWVGIDISPDAEDITGVRLMEEVDKAANLFNPLTDIIVRKDAPERTDNTEERAVQMRLPRYQTHKPELFGKQQGKCNGCQHLFHFRNLTVDHITPQSKGGNDHIENLQLLCAACNSTKGNGTQAELISRLTEQGVLKE